MNYAQQAHKPEWYKVDDTKLYHAATSGSSPFNEWYEFNNRAESVEFLADHLPDDKFCYVGGEIWDMEDLTYDEVSEGFVCPTKGQPADIQEIIEASSKF